MKIAYETCDVPLRHFLLALCCSNMAKSKIFYKPMKKTSESFTKLAMALTCFPKFSEINIITCRGTDFAKPDFKVGK